MSMHKYNISQTSQDRHILKMKVKENRVYLKKWQAELHISFNIVWSEQCLN